MSNKEENRKKTDDHRVWGEGEAGGIMGMLGKTCKKTEKEDLRKMVAEALGIAVKTVLKNHIFRFNEEIRKQLSGGTKSVKAAGNIANLFMFWWDEEYLLRVLDFRDLFFGFRSVLITI